MTLTPPAPEASWSPGKWTRLWECRALQAPRWRQAILLNEATVFGQLLVEHPGLLEEKDGGRSPLEWAVRLRRVGMVRAAIKAGANLEMATWYLEESLATRWDPAGSVWDALLDAGIPVRERHLRAALAGETSAADRFFQAHAPTVLRHEKAGIGIFLEPPSTSMVLERRGDDAAAARAFERAVVLVGAPTRDQLMAVWHAWVKKTEEFSGAWELGRARLAAMSKHMAPQGDELEGFVLDLLGPRANPRGSRGPDARDWSVACSLAAIGDWWAPADGIALTPTARQRMAMVGPATATLLLSDTHYCRPAGTAQAVEEWLEETVGWGRVLKDLPNASAYAAWAQGLRDHPAGAEGVERWALANPDDGFAALVALAIVQGLLAWWTPSAPARRALWSRAMHNVTYGADPGWTELLLGQGWTAQDGFESLLAAVENAWSKRRFELGATVGSAAEQLRAAGASWATPDALSLWTRLLAYCDSLPNGPSRALLDRWRLEQILPEQSPRARVRL